MAKPIALKTGRNSGSVNSFLKSIPDPAMRADAKVLDRLMRTITGHRPALWGASIVGYDSYTYTRSNGDYGEYLALGFSPRKTALTLYIMPGYQDYSALLKKLGPHKIGKSCLYIKRLADIDMQVLEALLTRGYQDLKRQAKTGL